MLGIFRNSTVCSCSEDSVNWSWPFTRAHERYHDLTVTTVTCLKHPWSVRLYDPKQMKFVKVAEKNVKSCGARFRPAQSCIKAHWEGSLKRA